MSAVRISKVRMKDTGCEVKIHDGVRVKTPAMDLLQDRLAEIRSGEIQAIGFVSIYADGAVGTGWCEVCAQDVFRFLGGVENLKNRFWSEVIHNE